MIVSAIAIVCIVTVILVGAFRLTCQISLDSDSLSKRQQKAADKSKNRIVLQAMRAAIKAADCGLDVTDCDIRAMLGKPHMSDAEFRNMTPIIDAAIQELENRNLSVGLVASDRSKMYISWRAPRKQEDTILL